MSPRLTAARIRLERLEKMLAMLRALEAWERGEIVGGFNGKLEPQTVSPEAKTLYRAQQQQRQRIIQRRLRAAPTPIRGDLPRPRGQREQRAASPNRSRRTAGAVLRGPPEDPSEPSGGDEPPLDSVTVSRSCVVCDAELKGRRRQAAHCSNACRQKAYRRRRAPRPVQLTAELRTFLRAEIDRRARQRIAAHDRAAGVALLEEWRRAA